MRLPFAAESKQEKLVISALEVRRAQAAKLVLHVATVSRGVAVNGWELLKQQENRRDMPRLERGELLS
jgi:hypothetical protein